MERKLTWHLKMMVFNRNLLFQGLIFRFHVSFPGCIRGWECFFFVFHPMGTFKFPQVNRVLYKVALVPLGDYVFFLAQFTTFGFLGEGDRTQTGRFLKEGSGPVRL